MKSILKLRRYDSIQEEVGAFKRYQIRVLLITQLANAAITGSMLCTVFDMVAPVLITCYDDNYNSGRVNDESSNKELRKDQPIMTSGQVHSKLSASLLFSSTADESLVGKRSADFESSQVYSDELSPNVLSDESSVLSAFYMNNNDNNRRSAKNNNSDSIDADKFRRRDIDNNDSDTVVSNSLSADSRRNVSDNTTSAAAAAVCLCRNGSYKVDFYSISYQLRLYCAHSYIPTLMTSSVMLGGVAGSALFGFLADRHGRKLICIFTLVGLGTFNGFLYFAAYHWSLVLGTYLIMGAFGGGYMVVNMVLLIECVGGAKWRLLCSCLNGWPFGMITMALLGVTLKYWLWFHLLLAGLSFLFAVLLAVFVYESPRWLITRDRITEAENILSDIATINKCFISFQRHVMGLDEDDHDWSATNNDGGQSRKTSSKLNAARNGYSSTSVKSTATGTTTDHSNNGSRSYHSNHGNHSNRGNQSNAKSYHERSPPERIKLVNDDEDPNGDDVYNNIVVADSPESRDQRQQHQIDTKLYSYLDLARNRTIFKRLSALSYCWLASSIISFGLFFTMGNLAGDRYVNTFLIGLFKGTMGFVPFVLDRWSGRRPILIVSVLVTCLTCWSSVVAYYAGHGIDQGVWYTILAIVGSAAIDPMWKINHLYSAELFPTVIRNMARAVCNVFSRLGSLIGPQMSYLSRVYFPAPYFIYGLIGLVQFLVVLLCLPETKGKPLDDRMPPITTTTTTRTSAKTKASTTAKSAVTVPANRRQSGSGRPGGNDGSSVKSEKESPTKITV